MSLMGKDHIGYTILRCEYKKIRYICKGANQIWSNNMPHKEKEITKRYYSMGEVTTLFGVNASLIRFYEKEFDILQPRKNKKGNRMFRPEDIESLKIIFNLVKDKGYTIQGAKDYLKENQKGARENQRVIDSLEKLKGFLLEVRDSL